MDHYDNPEVSNVMNEGGSSSLREFLSLSATLALGVIVFVAAVFFSMRWLLPFVPFSLEERLASPVAAYFQAKEEAPDKRFYLQELADELALHMNLPEGMKIKVHWSADDAPNAFATLGGHITIFQGAIDAVESENALAMVLAHEIAHVQHRDPLVSAGGSLLVGLSLQALLGSGGDSAVSQVSSALSQLQFSRRQEAAADAAALQALRGYYGHTEGAEGFFLAIQNNAGLQSRFPELLSSHPDVEKRLATIAASRPVENRSSVSQTGLKPLPAFLKSTEKRVERIE